MVVEVVVAPPAGNIVTNTIVLSSYRWASYLYAPHNVTGKTHSFVQYFYFSKFSNFFTIRKRPKTWTTLSTLFISKPELRSVWWSWSGSGGGGGVQSGWSEFREGLWLFLTISVTFDLLLCVGLAGFSPYLESSLSLVPTSLQVNWAELQYFLVLWSSGSLSVVSRNPLGLLSAFLARQEIFGVFLELGMRSGRAGSGGSGGSEEVRTKDQS